MVLSIVLFIIIILLLALLIMFLFYIFFPAIKEQSNVHENPVISMAEVNYRSAESHEKIPVSEERAVILCNCKKDCGIPKVRFNSEYSCRMINSVYGTGTDCKFACIGLGDCVKKCPQTAIVLENRTAVVTNLCIGCGKCLNVCPLNIIKLVPKDSKELILCSNTEDDKVVCSSKGKKEIVSWNDKKGFKIWSYCYRMYLKIRNTLWG